MEFSELSPDEDCRPVSVHPLVVLSISDHVTRMDYVAFQREARGGAAQDEAAAEGDGSGAVRREHPLAPVLGILLGEHLPSTSRTGVEVVASFEAVLRGATDEISSLPHPPNKRFHAQTEAEGTAETEQTAWSYLQEDRQWYVDHIDWASVADMSEQMCRVHPEMHVVGWYTVGSELGDLAVCAQLNARVAAIVQQDEERRKRQAEDEANKRREQRTGAEPLSDGNNTTSSSTAAAAGSANAAAGHKANSAEETTEASLLALVVDARMSDHQAKLPVHVFTVRMNDAATVAALAPSTAVSAKTDTPALATRLHLDTLPSGMHVSEDAPMSVASVSESSPPPPPQKKVTTFLMTRFRIDSDEIEHIGIDGAMNVDLQARRVRLSDDALAARGESRFYAGRGGGGSRRQGLSQNDIALVRQALQTPAELGPSVARFRQALHVLRHRVRLLVLYLESIEKGGVQAVEEDDNMLREIASICAKLPCAPPLYPHAHWNDIHTQQHQQQQHQMPVTSPQPGHATAALCLPRTAHGEGAVNALVEERERTLLAALLTAQTKVALDLRPMQAAQARATHQLYQCTVDTKERIREETRQRQQVAAEQRSIDYDESGLGARGKTGSKLFGFKKRY